jgi:hypothetical protein
VWLTYYQNIQEKIQIFFIKKLYICFAMRSALAARMYAAVQLSSQQQQQQQQQMYVVKKKRNNKNILIYY